MTVFVILAAGKGGRMGRYDYVHKALLPYKGRAVISHQIAAAPDSRIVVVTGNRHEQVKDYLDLAHPGLPVTLIHKENWDVPGACGPAASLIDAKREIDNEEDFIFTSCDTLWENPSDIPLWYCGQSWSGVSPVPKGTKPERWVRIGPEGVFEKDEPGKGAAYTGLTCVKSWDAKRFWKGLRDAPLDVTEHQVTPGLKSLHEGGGLAAKPIKWTDTGDEASYRRAVEATGYDWSKPNEATYVLPDEGRVVKFRADAVAVMRLVERHKLISRALPKLTGVRTHFYAYEYVPGLSGYAAAAIDPDFIPKLVSWAKRNLWHAQVGSGIGEACERFYRQKTGGRLMMLRQELRDEAWACYRKIDWNLTVTGCQPATIHGDFNLGNIISDQDGKKITAIDWREDFAGLLKWGDLRYDYAKLLAGLYVNWDYARGGDFQDWDAGEYHIAQLALAMGGKIPRDVKVIAAVSLLNSAPLHAAPLDEHCVRKATEILETV